jgi:integrase
MANITKVGARYRAFVRRKGEKPISKYFTSKPEAQKWARAQEVEVDRGRSTAPGLRLTIAHLVDTYIENVPHAFGRTKVWNIEMIKDRLGALRLEELTVPAINTFIQKREREGAGPATNLQTLSYLRTVIRHGGALAGAGQAVPVALATLGITCDALVHAGRIAPSKERSRRPTEEELIMLMDHFDARLRSSINMTDIMLFAVSTTMRLGEITGLGGIVWEDLSEEDRTIWVRARKDPTMPGGRDMLVPLPSGPVVVAGQIIDPIAILLRQKTARLRTGRIFPYAEHTISNAFERACTQLKITDLRFHDMRHDAISRLFQAGWTIPKVAAVSGHKSWKNLQRYTQLDAALLSSNS